MLYPSPILVLSKQWTYGPTVAVNHENDTCFGKGLVMGHADCKYCAGLIETPKRCFKRKPDPFSDTLQAGACVFPPFQKSLDHVVKPRAGNHFSQQVIRLGFWAKKGNVFVFLVIIRFQIPFVPK